LSRAAQGKGKKRFEGGGMRTGGRRCQDLRVCGGGGERRKVGCAAGCGCEALRVPCPSGVLKEKASNREDVMGKRELNGSFIRRRTAVVGRNSRENNRLLG